MNTTAATPTPAVSNPQAPAGAPANGLPGPGFHLPSYLLGLTTALILSSAAFFFWPRQQPAALQLQAPPTLAPAAAAGSTTVAPTVAPTVAMPAPSPSPLVVFVSGAVAQPGLYTLAATARIGDALAAAGGLLPGVDPALINQAQPLMDGAQLHIPAPATTLTAASGAALEGPPLAAPTETQLAAEANVAAAPPTLALPAAQPPAGLSVAQPLALPTPTAAPAAPVASAERAATVELPAAGALINVNTATGPELESLPAIGPAKAQAIIDNRPYASVDELDRVPGIGPATLEQIRPHVTIE